MNKTKLFVALAFLILATLACVTPIGQEEGGEEEGGGAAAAITALAATNQAAFATAPNLASSGTTVTVSQAADCRSGPGSQYDKLGTLGAGQSARVVGKFTPGNYWIIDVPGGSGTCWLSGQYATTRGDTSGLPEIAPAVTPTP